VVGIRLRNREISTFNIAIICGQIEGSPITLVREVDIGTALDEVLSKPVMTIIGRRQQWRPTVLTDLVDVPRLYRGAASPIRCPLFAPQERVQ